MASQNFGLFRSFTLSFLLAIVFASVVAAALAPFVAWLLAALGFRFPFPRIFDRVVMVTSVIALLVIARPLGIASLLRAGFAREPGAGAQLIAGLLAALLVVLALMFAGSLALDRSFPVIAISRRAAHFAVAALFVAIFEEAFFRAILMGGMTRDFGAPFALLGSSLLYSLTHLIRSPKHYFLFGYHPSAGFANLGASLARIPHPGDLLPMALGLFLLGLVLGESFRRTRRVYLAIGLHAGFILGAKCWGAVAAGAAVMPTWLAGPGPVPLIAAPAAWACALLLFALMPLLGRAQLS